MDFINKAKKSITYAGKELGQKAGDMSAIAMLNLKIREKEKNLQEYYKRLGDLLYNEYPDEALRMYPELTKLISSFACDRHELAASKGNKICPNCGAEQPQDSRFCTSCGVNIEE